MNQPTHDLGKITDRHSDGSVREVAAYVLRDGERAYYARGSVQDAIRSARANPDLAGATYEIDLPRFDGADERRLTFGQAVTIEQLQEIASRSERQRERDDLAGAVAQAFAGITEEVEEALRVVARLEDSMQRARQRARELGATERQMLLAMHHEPLRTSKEEVGPETPGAFFCQRCGCWLLQGGTVHDEGEHEPRER